MPLFNPAATITLDYAEAAAEDTLQNISGIAADGADRLWTVSDEGRTVECLRRDGDKFLLTRQFRLDDLVDDIPGPDKEIDLEAVCVSGGQLWLCGSHSRNRRKAGIGQPVDPKIRKRPSRHLLATFDIAASTGMLSAPRRVPFDGPASLRGTLEGDPHLKPFLELPGKENGLDIEGMARLDDALWLGLRGPLVAGKAVALELRLSASLRIERYELAFLDLGGLGIRDLVERNGRLLVLAGPVSDARGPFEIHGWAPERVATVQRTTSVLTWPSTSEKPEGLCVLGHDGKPGIAVVYDGPSASRISGSTYRADWMPLSSVPGL